MYLYCCCFVFSYIQINEQRNFTSNQIPSVMSDIADAMCDLLAYHDELEAISENLTAFQNMSRDLQTLLEANIQDSCAWVR